MSLLILEQRSTIWHLTWLHSKMADFFATPQDLRDWLTDNHLGKQELWVGYYKKSTGIPSITWPESVDQALCFGWIDGIRKRIDDESYMVRFTPRKAKSHWSNVNLRRIKELKEQGLVLKEGLEAFNRRTPEKTANASYEQNKITLDPKFEKAIKKNKKAWHFFSEKLAPSYRKQAVWWIMSAKKEETKARRLRILIESSEKETLIPPLRWTKK